jgi:glutathione S-transferase
LKLNDTLFGEQVPSLEIDGIVLTQSWTIIRYLSRTRSLEPADNTTWAKVNTIFSYHQII